MLGLSWVHDAKVKSAPLCHLPGKGMQVLVAMGWIHSGATSFVHDDSTISSPSNLLRHLWQIPWKQSFPNLLLAGQTARRSQTWLPQNLHVLHGYVARFINLLSSSIHILYMIHLFNLNFIKFHSTWFHEQHVNECPLATSAVGNRSKMCACSRVSWPKSATSSKPWDNKPLVGSSWRVKPKLFLFNNSYFLWICILFTADPSSSCWY